MKRGTEKQKMNPVTRGMVYSVAVFGALCLGQVRAITVMLMTAALGGILLSLLRKRAFGSLPLLLLGLITALGGISMFYGMSGKFAIQGFCGLMNGLCVAALLTALAPEEDRLPAGAAALAGAGALLSFFSIDHLSTRLLSGGLLKLLGTVTDAYGAVSGLEAGVRMTSFLDAPNVFAGIAGLGVLLSLGLAHRSGKKEKYGALALLYVNSLGFLLAFSMGATVAMLIAFVTLLIFEKDREDLLLLMLRTLLVAVLGLIPASVSGLDPWNGIRFVPMLSLILGTAVLCLTEKIRLPVKKRPVFPVLLGILAASAVFAVAAWNWTGSAALDAGQSLRRAVYPPAGTYDLSFAGDGDVTVRIESQNLQQTMMHTETVLYEGPLQDAEVTVGEDALVVYLNFFTGDGGALEEVALGEEKVTLDRVLIPDFMENRLQGILANENAIQRMVFFQDGLKLWKRSPLVGCGLGAFEAGLFSVQEFYYETKYVHNHYIQTLLETGILGLALFLLLLIGSFVKIFRGRKQPFAPALAAAVVFMALHAGVEVVFSAASYLPVAFGVFALTGLLEEDKKKWYAPTTAILIAAFLPVLLCNLWAASIGKNAKTLEDLRRAAELDPIEWTDYALSYVANAPNVGTAEAMAQAEEYVLRLEGEDSNTIHYYLARFCFQTGQKERAMEMLLKQARATASSSRWWNTVYALVYEYYDGSPQIREGLEALVFLMESWDDANMGAITLEEQVAQALAWMIGG